MLEILVNNPLTRNFFGCNRSIGIVGMGMAGKTVFLTSLLDHLRNHHPQRYPHRFDLGEKRISEWEILPFSVSGIWKPFPFEEFRARMANQHLWPQRTTDCSRIDLKFKFTPLSQRWFSAEGERSWNDYYLTLYDIPGERTPDVVLYENDYASWSRQTLLSMRRYYHQYQENPNSLAEVRSFLNRMENPQADLSGEAIVRFYKRALIEMLENGCSNVTPSIFMVDDTGKRFREKAIHGCGDENERENLVENCLCGVRGAEFAPLGENWRSHPVFATFQRACQQYRKQYVYPLFGTLISCDALAFLVDIPTILKNGSRDLNMYREILGHLLRGLHPGDTTLSLLLTLGFQHRIGRIAFAATQCDRFHPDDRPVLQSMVQHLADPVCNQISQHYQYDFSTIAAVESARLIDGKMHCDTAQGEAALDYWRIPKEWKGDFPNDAQSEAFISSCQSLGQIVPPRVRPRFSQNEATPPHQIRLDRLFRFLTRW
ncbi:MAG: YcjX family protein [Planctomycetia bacterium]|nr:YcjX family protein [Planctomycetia bacterium]